MGTGKKVLAAIALIIAAVLAVAEAFPAAALQTGMISFPGSWVESCLVVGQVLVEG